MSPDRDAAAGRPGASPVRSTHLRTALAPAADGLTFHWPWSIASKGADYLSSLADVADALADAGRAVASSSPGDVAAVAADPTSTDATGAVLDSGLFGPALDAVRADTLLRSTLVGWAGGAQIGVFGGGGGVGVAYDVVAPDDHAAVTYGLFAVGIGGQVSTGLLLGAMTAQPGELNGSIAAWESGVSLAGIGAFVTVLMAEDDLRLLGFTVNVGVGGGFSSATGYGKIDAS